MENSQRQTTEEEQVKNKWHKNWWHNRSKQEKWLILTALIISIILIITLIVYSTIGGAGLCQNPTCVRTSFEIQNFLNTKTNPCGDFYNFACGNFQLNSNENITRTAQHIVTEGIQAQIRNMLEQPIHPKEPIAFNLGKKFYRACINESAIEAEGLTRMKQIFERIGGWPTLTGGVWNENSFNWTNALCELRKIGISFPFFFNLAVEEDQAGKYILTIKDPLYKPSSINENIKMKYHQYMVNVAMAFGAQKERAEREQTEVLDFILELAKTSERARQNITKPRYYKISELQHDFSGVPWFSFISNFLYPIRINQNDHIKVSNPTWLLELIYFLHPKSDRQKANFISWHIIQHLIPFLPSNILNNAYNYFENITEIYDRMPRWSVCVDETKKRLKSVILAAYVEESITDDVRREVISLIQNIKDQFKLNLYKLEWLNEDEKNKAITKIMTTAIHLPSASELVDDEIIYGYEKVEIFEDKVLKSVLNLDLANTNIEYGRLGKYAKDNILKDPSFVEGFKINYLPKENALIIPAGLFQSIYYQKDRPNYINYGALGSVIAHKLSHIIVEAEDMEDQQLRSTWSSHTLQKYEEQLNCLEQQYIRWPYRSLNTALTRYEYMADLAGMRLSYDTYIRWVKDNGPEPQLPGLNYSSNQLFWISSAIHHCTKYFPQTQTSQRYIANYRSSLEQLRVIGPLQNIPEFAYDFGCPLGSKMNPEDKCLVW